MELEIDEVIIAGDIERVNLLLQRGATILGTSESISALHYAAVYGRMVAGKGWGRHFRGGCQRLHCSAVYCVLVLPQILQPSSGF
jgi:hypothetical protein